MDADAHLREAVRDDAVLDAGCWMLDALAAGCWMLDAGAIVVCLIRRT